MGTSSRFRDSPSASALASPFVVPHDTAIKKCWEAPHRGAEGDDVDASLDGALRIDAPAAGRPAFLLDQQAGPPERRRASIIAMVSVLTFAALVPFASRPLAVLPAFIPLYEAALLVLDLVTAVLLLGQYRILGSRASLALACGYLFTAAMTSAHALSFPGLFSPGGLLGAGAQSTAWIYMFWHGGFPLFLIAYALLDGSGKARAPSPGAVWRWPLATLGLAAALTALATQGQDLLPTIMAGSRHTPTMLFTVGTVWLCTVAALLVLWRRRTGKVLDLWLMIVCLAWIFDIGLSALLNAGRYDLGFYAGRIYGFIACAVVLMELLLENSLLHARLYEAYEADLRLNAALTSARDEAQAGSAAKSLFLASMSHEIRTPMNAIIGLTHLVLDTPLDERQRDYLGKVQTSSKALLTLLNDILDYSKIEAGKVAIETEEFSPEETLENVGNLFSAKIEEAGLDLLFEIDERIPARLLGDPLRLTQVLNNLVGNAIKFTPRGEIVVAAKVAAEDESHVTLDISVRDTGIGMAEEQIARLFQAFSQADASITRRYGGTGLGLAICKRLVELMGGHIAVASQPGEGSSFRFSCSFGRASAGLERIDLHRIRGMRTLIVNAQPTERLILQKILQSWRFQVATASFADEALFRLRQTDPDLPYELLLVDWKTAGIDFIEAARRTVADRSTAPLAAIALSGLHDSVEVEAAMQDLPTSGVLVKPVTPSRLFDAIMQLQHGGRPDTVLPGSKALNLAESLKPLRGARLLLVEDNLVNQQVAYAFLSMGQVEVEIANNGVEAVDRLRTSAARYDGVLMDVQMPEMDGLTATRLIRALPGGAQVPIIAMTADATERDMQDCLAAGMNAHISKPIDVNELVSTLQAWIVPRRTSAAGLQVRSP